DESFFMDAMRNVREISEFRKMTVSRHKHEHAGKENAGEKDALRVLGEIVQGKRPINLADTQEYIEWINKDYQGGIARDLH
ncbi:MAG: hypothetical protein GTO08_03500, partial [Deltaproteobacteria bacterium]|nr:hypothetical protein [Deltaproteobacteria bacterium]